MIITLFIFTIFTKCILFAKKIILTEFSFLFSRSVPYEHRDSTINILWKLLFSRNICLRSNFFQDKYLIFFFISIHNTKEIFCAHIHEVWTRLVGRDQKLYIFTLCERKVFGWSSPIVPNRAFLQMCMYTITSSLLFHFRWWKRRIPTF